MFLLFCFTVQYITARCGHNIILPCRVSRDTTVDALEWTRSDLESEGYVFLLRYGIPDTANQHPSFKNRVELSNSLLNDGNLSVILKNVSSSDAGRYECRLKDSDARFYKRAINKLIRREPISIIELTVIESGEFVQSRVRWIISHHIGRSYLTLISALQSSQMKTLGIKETQRMKMTQ